MMFRFRYRVIGNHTHVRLFVGDSETLANSGTLIFRPEEWKTFMNEMGLSRSNWQFVNDTKEELNND